MSASATPFRAKKGLSRASASPCDPTAPNAIQPPGPCHCTFNQNTFTKTAFPGLVTGSFGATTFSQFWGAEVNFRYNLCCGCNYRIDALGGFRYLRLHENLTIDDVENLAIPGLPRPAVFTAAESFDTKNNFYGGQLGLTGEYWRDRCFVQLTGKVALGGNSRTAEIGGTSTLSGGLAGPVVFPQGTLFALPSNSGIHRDTAFSVVPEVDLNFGYQLTKHLRVMVGYSCLAWTHVVRPGDQIDTTINTSQRFGGALVGEARPAFQFQNSTFWAQGVNVGLEFRY